MKKKTEDQKLKTARRRKLINHLKKVERTNPHTFHLSDWVSLSLGDSIESLVNDLSKGRSHPCGTTCCVAGNLPIIFPEDWEFPMSLHSGEYMGGVRYVSAGDCLSISSHMAGFFGGSRENWSRVIYPENYIGVATIEMVIEKISILHKTLM